MSSRFKAVWLVFGLAVSGCGDTESSSGDVGPEAGADAAAQLDGSALEDAARDGAMDDGSVGDAATDAATIEDASTEGGSIEDGSVEDAALDGSAPDTCDLSACPDPSGIPGFGDQVRQACCLGDQCGILRDSEDWFSECEPIDPGSSDEYCVDADMRAVDGGVLQGCCRADNECGHFDEQVGCHTFINDAWLDELKSCDGPPPELPEGPFECKGDEPCTYDWECCGHYNYQTQCSPAPGSGDVSVCNHCPDC